MREIMLNLIRQFLQEQPEIFLSEKELQLNLAQCFMNSNEFDNVFLEYHVPIHLINGYPWNGGNNQYIDVDIVLESNGSFYPLEIKYRTANQELQRNIFGGNTNIQLRNQVARNLGCYNFWKDVKRIELLEENFQNVQRGAVLFVTNDHSYPIPPRNENVGYAQFSLYQERDVPAHVELGWNGNPTVANGRPGFQLNYEYTINWVNMPLNQFCYLLV